MAISVFVCLSVYFTVRSLKSRVQMSSNFLYILLVAMAWSSYLTVHGNALRHVLLRFYGWRHVFTWRNKWPESKTTRMFRPLRQVAEPCAKSAISDCIFWSCSFCLLLAEKERIGIGRTQNGFKRRILLLSTELCSHMISAAHGYIGFPSTNSPFPSFPT